MRKLYTFFSVVIICLSSNAQTFAWAKRSGGTSSENGVSVVTDASGNVYTLSLFNSSSVDFDPGPGVFTLSGPGLAVVKFDAAGNFVFAKGIGGTIYPNKIAIDGAGNILAVGSFNGTVDFDPGPGTTSLTSAGNDIFILKLDPSGNFSWAKAIGNTLFDVAWECTTDVSGYVYVTGYYAGTVDFDPGPGVYNCTSVSNSSDFFILRLGPSGNFIWVRTAGSTTSDQGTCVLSDGSGNIYVAGVFYNTVDFDPGPGVFNLTSAGNADVFLLKLDTSGNFVWAKAMGGTAVDQPKAISMDVFGDILLTGTFSDTADFDPGPGVVNLVAVGAAATFICKFNSAGVLTWARSFSIYSFVEGIDTDATGNVYTTGSFANVVDFDPGPANYNIFSQGNEDVFIAKLDASANFISVKSIGSTNTDNSYDINIDAFGNVYTTGSFQLSPDFNTDAGTFTMSSAGSSDIFLHKMTTCSSAPSTPGTVSGNSAVCIGSSNTYSIAAVSGATSYTWNLPGGWIGASTTTNITGIAGSSGNITVTANNACGSSVAQTFSVTVSNPVLTLTPASASCFGVCDGSIGAVTTGGISPYSYSPSLTAMCAGSYTVTVTDNIGCTTQLSATVMEPGALSLTTSSVVNATCSGLCNGSVTLTGNGGTPSYSYSPSPANLCAGTYTFTVTDANGCTSSASASITEPPQLTLSESHTDNLCNAACNATVNLSAVGGVPPYSYTGATNNLCAGTYTYTVTDANSCTAQTTVTITEPAAITATFSATPDTICAGGCSVLAAGGASGGTAPYAYLWMPGNFNSNTATVCPATTTCYTSTITDANGCTGAATVCIVVNALPSVSYVQTPTFTCIDWNPISLSAGFPAGGIYSGPGVTGAQFDPAAATAGTWDIVYTYTDGNGCADSVAQQITVDLCTGIGQQPDQNAIAIFPNLTNGNVTVQGMDQNAIVELLDVSGKLLYTQQVYTGQTVLDLSPFTAGIYYVRIMSEKGVVVRKVIRME